MSLFQYNTSGRFLARNFLLATVALVSVTLFAGANPTQTSRSAPVVFSPKNNQGGTGNLLRRRDGINSFAQHSVAQAQSALEPKNSREAESEGPSSGTEFFEQKIRPILVESCYACHSAASKPLMGNLRLDSRNALLKGGAHGTALVPGQPEDSLLLKAIRYQDRGLQMPPKGKLPDEQIAALTEWVKMGAPWPSERMKAEGGRMNPNQNLHPSSFILHPSKHWSFQPLKAQKLPVVNNKAWVKSPIDAFILAKLEAKGLQPAPPADKRALIRRVTYDLIGLPPTPAESEAFLRDKSPDAYRKVVDRLLASPHYGERWARHWLDLARYAETDGHEFDFDKPNAYRYRDYVIRALNDDIPYNQFVLEQIAGDLLPTPRRHPTEGFNESILGTGFWWLGEGTHSPVDILEDQSARVDNQIDVFGKAFLGLSVGCARCHDHKFDPIATKDYYALSGFLKSSRYEQAVIDAPEPLRRGAQELEALNTRIQPLLLANVAGGLARQAEQAGRSLLAAREVSGSGTRAVSETSPPPDAALRDRWARYARETAAKNPLDPLYPWSVLTGPAAQTPEAFAQARDLLVKNLRALAESAQQATQALTVFTDFRKDSYAGWYVTGEAFGNSPTRTTAARQDSRNPSHIIGISGAGVADSGRVSPQLQGTLRSRTFTLEKRYVLYHLAGRDADVRLIIDGFQRIQAPIYGGLALRVNTNDAPQWIAQDVSKWIGHRAYIEILDRGSGYVAIDKIAFAESGPPPSAPNPLVLQMLDDPALTSANLLAQKYRTLLTQTAERTREERLDSAPDAAARLELLDWMLHNGLMTNNGDTLTPEQAKTLTSLLAERANLERRLPEPRRAMVTADGTGEDDRVHIRGGYKQLGEIAPRRFLPICGGSQPSSRIEGSGRLSLAQRVIAPSDPLLPRVIVNRLWQHHFGEGLVRTPDDFGLRGERPTHPELLEWLAFHFVEGGNWVIGSSGNWEKRNQPAASSQLPNYPMTQLPNPYACGWSLKKLHRLMVLSATYQMASEPVAKTEEADPQNKWLHRIPVRRLEAECIRDAILAVSGRLDKTLYGPSVLPYLTPFMEGRGKPSVSGPLDGAGRRSIYISVRRNFLTPLFLAFDYPIPFNTMGRRAVSNVPAQALTLMNNPFVVEQAAVWAKRVLAEPGDAAQHIRAMYETAFGRPPTKAELADALAFLRAQGAQYGSPNDLRAWSDLGHVLINVKEFIFLK